MDRNPSVSVIIPSYNRFAMLCQAIDSVFAQTEQDYELIVVDDGSTDNTPAVQDLYQGKLRYIQQENRGASAARNRGVEKARGRWVCFLDSDDLWLPNKLAVQKCAMAAAPDFRISYTEEIWYRDGVRVNPMKKHAKHSGWIFEKSLTLCIISPSSVMIRKSLFRETGGFDESFSVCEDYDLWLRISKDHPVLLVREPLIIKRNGHSGQLSASGWGFDRYRVKSMVKLMKQGNLTDAQGQACKNILQKKCQIISTGYYKRGNSDKGAYYAKLADV